MFQTETAVPAGSWTEDHKVQSNTESGKHWEGLSSLQLPWDGHCPHSVIDTSSPSAMWILRWRSRSFMPWTVLKLQPGYQQWMSFLRDHCLFLWLWGKSQGRGFLGIIAVCGGQVGFGTLMSEKIYSLRLWEYSKYNKELLNSNHGSAQNRFTLKLT